MDWIRGDRPRHKADERLEAGVERWHQAAERARFFPMLTRSTRPRHTRMGQLCRGSRADCLTAGFCAAGGRDGGLLVFWFWSPEYQKLRLIALTMNNIRQVPAVQISTEALRAENELMERTWSRACQCPRFKFWVPWDFYVSCVHDKCSAPRLAKPVGPPTQLRVNPKRARGSKSGSPPSPE
jgi:hypothetical protein